MEFQDLLYLILFIVGPVVASILQKRREKGAPPVRDPRAKRPPHPPGPVARPSPAGKTAPERRRALQSIQDKLRELEEAQVAGRPMGLPRPRSSLPPGVPPIPVPPPGSRPRPSSPPRSPASSAGFAGPLPAGISIESSPRRARPRAEDDHYRVRDSSPRVARHHPIFQGLASVPRHEGAPLSPVQHAFILSEVFGAPRALRPFTPGGHTLWTAPARREGARPAGSAGT